MALTEGGKLTLEEIPEAIASLYKADYDKGRRVPDQYHQALKLKQAEQTLPRLTSPGDINVDIMSKAFKEHKVSPV